MINERDSLLVQVFRLGHGEPADLYTSEEFHSSLEDWTAEQATRIILRSMERRKTLSEDTPVITDNI